MKSIAHVTVSTTAAQLDIPNRTRRVSLRNLDSSITVQMGDHTVTATGAATDQWPIQAGEVASFTVKPEEDEVWLVTPSSTVKMAVVYEDDE